MKHKNAILLIVIVVFIVIGEIVKNNTNNPTWRWIFSIAALGTAILSATSKESKLKRSHLIIMIAVALLFILYPILL